MTAPHQYARTGGDLRVLRAAVFAAVCVVLAAAGHSVASCATVPLWSLGAGFLTVFAVAAPLAGRERSLPGITALLAAGQTVLHTLFGLGQHGTTATAAAGTDASLVDASLVARAARLVCGASVATLSPAQAQRILADAQVGTGGAGGAGGMSGVGGANSAGPGGAHALHQQADALSAAAGAPVLPSLSMLLCHLLAAVATGWLLRRGDIALRRLLRLSAHGVAETALTPLRAALALVRALLTGLPGAAPAAPGVPRTREGGPPAPRTTALQHSVVRRGPPAGRAFTLAA